MDKAEIKNLEKILLTPDTNKKIKKLNHSYPLYYDYPDKMVFNGSVVASFPYKLILDELNEDIVAITKFNKTKNFTKYKKLWAIILDRTLFFPGGGGQPADLGVLENQKNSRYSFTIEVLTTFKLPNNTILHICDHSLPKRTTLKGTLDRSHRRTYQQLHSAQHIISAILYRKYNIQTLSVNFENIEKSILIDSKKISKFDANLIEKEVQQLCRKNTLIHSTETSREKLNLSMLRKPPTAKMNPLRIVEIENLDKVPCCGLHNKNTIELMPIYITNIKLEADSTRLFFTAGEEANRLFHSYNYTLQDLKEKLSSPIEKIQENYNKEKQKFQTKIKQKNNIEKEIAEFILKNIKDEKIISLFSFNYDASRKIANQLANILSKEKKNSLILLKKKENFFWILCGHNCEEAFFRLTAEIKKLGGNGGGRKNRFEGMLPLSALGWLKSHFEKD